MWGFSSGTVYKLVIKEDGSPNWVGIIILSVSLLALFFWRCCEFVPENWVATRLRFKRVVRNKDGMPREYDPLAPRPIKPIGRWQFLRRLRRQIRRWRGKAEPVEKKTRSFRFRFYMVNSLVLTNCGKRETNLDIDAISLRDMDFDTVLTAVWSVSRVPGCPTKSYLVVATSGWSWRNKKDELEDLVRRHIADAVVRAYEAIEESLKQTPKRLPLLEMADNPHLIKVKDELLEEYGVEFTGLLFGRRSVAPARRVLEGLAKVANALRLRVGLPEERGYEEDVEEEVAAASATTAAIASVIELHRP